MPGPQEQDRNDNVVNEYTHGLGLPGGIGGLLHLNQGGAHYSYLYDGKGNVTALLDSNATVAATYQYDPFGKARNITGSVNQSFQFSTKPYDEKTGLSYYGYRFYVPALGRWLTRDPLGEEEDINLYAFVGNDPINFVDPDGFFAVPAAAAAAVAFFPEARAAWPSARAAAASVAAAFAAAMAKGGNQNYENPWSREARRQPDPCKWLRDQYNKPENKKNKCVRKDIQKAQKVLGCRETGGDY